MQTHYFKRLKSTDELIKKIIKLEYQIFLNDFNTFQPTINTKNEKLKL